MILLLAILLLNTSIVTLQAAEIFRYEAPIVTVRAGNAWIVNGNLKLVHLIDLESYTTIASNVTALVEKHLQPSHNKVIIQHYLTQVQERLIELKGTKKRKPRSIDWIGSAWKWVAGNPDATDWNNILSSQNTLITNNNEQYKINAQLFNATNEVVKKTNELVLRINEIADGKEAEGIGQRTINQVLILKDVVDEIVRACQMAKSGIVNTNLLDRDEVEGVINEMETLPYSNAIEAIEYGKPSIFANGSSLLYVVSIPKVKTNLYHRLMVRSTINSGKRIVLPFNEILISQNETYGMKNPCLYINNVTVCQSSSLDKLIEETCIPRLLKGGIANCQYIRTEAQITEMITPDMVFLTNYIGTITTKGRKEFLNGTYLIQLSNETILIDDKTFSSTSISRMQPLPPLLTSVANERLLVNLDQVHNISLHNIDNIKHLEMRSNLTLSCQTVAAIRMSICRGLLWYRLTRRHNLPVVETPRVMITCPSPQTSQAICGTQIFKEGGVNNSGNTAYEANLAVSA